MARSEPPEAGTLLIAALLLLLLAFAGTWIIAYVEPNTNPWRIVPWFLGAQPDGVEHPAPNHSNRMVLKEDAMASGIALHAAIATRFLERAAQA